MLEFQEGIPLPVFDTFQTYLLVVNLSALLLNTWHFYLRSRDGRDHVSDAVRIMLLVAGGAAGSLLPLAAWDRRTKKDNALLHVLTLALLVIWGVAYAFIYVCPPDLATFMDKLLVRRDALCVYLGAASLVTLVTFGADKLCAIRQRSRIPEAVLLGLSVLGGSPGGLLGMLLFRHKIRSPQFAWGLPLVLAAQLLLAAYLINAGIL